MKPGPMIFKKRFIGFFSWSFSALVAIKLVQVARKIRWEALTYHKHFAAPRLFPTANCICDRERLCVRCSSEQNLVCYQNSFVLYCSAYMLGNNGRDLRSANFAPNEVTWHRTRQKLSAELRG